MLQNPETALGSVERDGLAQRALEVLEANWRGASTVPSPALYPHQWSWDSACIAIGYSHLNQERAEQELRSLFAGQWRNGLLPHIVFADGQDYFPGPGVLADRVLGAMPPRTGGRPASSSPLCTPRRCSQVYRNDPDRERARKSSSELLPKLEAWHAYLYRERNRAGDGVDRDLAPVGVGHGQLAALGPGAVAHRPDGRQGVPEYERIDPQARRPRRAPNRLGSTTATPISSSSIAT